MATNNLIHRLQNEHLPELLTLHQDCRWLISKLNIAEKEDLQSNELRLLQFSSIVDNMITQIKSYQSNYKFTGDDEKRLLELEGKISNSVLPLKTRLLERMQLRTDFKPPSNVSSQTQTQKQVQVPPIQATQTLPQPQSHIAYQLQLQKQRYQQPLAQPCATFQPQYNGIMKDNIGHGNYPAIIQLADVENSAKILITDSCTSSSDYTSESTSSDKDSNVDNPHGKVDKDFCQQRIPPPPPSQTFQKVQVAPHSGAPSSSTAVARPKAVGVVKAAPAINSAATTTACNGMAKALGQSNLSAHGTGKLSGPQESDMASSLQPTAPSKPNLLPPSAAANKSVSTGMVRSINKANDNTNSNSAAVNSNSKAVLPPPSAAAGSNKNVSGVVPPVQAATVSKCSPLTAKLYGSYANLFAATAAPATATTASTSTASKEPATQSQTKKSIGIAVKQPSITTVASKPSTTESIPPIHPNNAPNYSTSINSNINANGNANKSTVSAPPEREEDTYNKLFQLWASAAEDPLSKQQQRSGSKQAVRVSDADGQATSRSRANSVELFFSDDDEYSTFDSLEYDKISEDVLRNNATNNALQGGPQTASALRYGISGAPSVQTTSFINAPPGNVYSSSGNAIINSNNIGGSFASVHNGGLPATYSDEITHEDVINGLQKPGYLPKRPSFNKNVFDDGCGDNLEVNCFGEAVLISDIPIMEPSVPIHPYNNNNNNNNNYKPSGLANLSTFVMYPGGGSFSGGVTTTSSASNKRQIAEISNAGATTYGTKAPNTLNRAGDAKKSSPTSTSASAASSSRTTASTTIASSASTTNNGSGGGSGSGNCNAYRSGGIESTSSTISSTTSTGSAISLDPLRRQQVCIKNEIMSLMQPIKESNVAPPSSSTPKVDPMILQASISNIKRSPSTSDEAEIQYYKSSVDIDPSNAMALGGFDNGSVKEANGDEFMSSRRRKRLHQIVPNPRKPRQADYTCFMCSETYRCNVNDNPWWAVYTHECPRCKQLQIPRLDITTPSNAIELDPNTMALYGEGLEDGGEDADGDDYGSDDDESYDENSKEETMPLGQGAEGNALDQASPTLSGDSSGGIGDGANNKDGDEEKPFEGEGAMQKEEASKLLVLMCHARVCSGSHSSAKHADICKSTKFLMLHIRDCRGVDVHGRECLFPWCGPCKKMLKHLAQCFTPETCHVCNPWVLPESYQQLRRLNQMKLCQVTGGSSS